MFEKIAAKAKSALKRGDPQRLSLPAGMPGGATGIALEGRSYVEIDGCRGLTEYGEARVSMRVKEGALTVTGRGLELKIYHGGRVAVCGDLDGVFFEDGGENR